MRNQKLAELLHQYFELGVAEGREGRKHDTEAGDAQRVLSEIETEIAALSAADPVSSIVPDHCSGTALVFQGGCLHVRADGSGHIVVDEDDFKLEDDRCEGEHGPEGSVHWIARFPAGEMTALRNFLNGQDFPAPPALSAQVQDVAGWQTRRPQQFLDKYPDASEYVMHLHATEREARIAGLPNSAMVNGNFPEDAIASVTVRPVFAAAPAKQEG